MRAAARDPLSYATGRDLLTPFRDRRIGAYTLLPWLYGGRVAVAVLLFLSLAREWGASSSQVTFSATLLLVTAILFAACSFGYTHLAGRPAGRNFLYGQLLFDVMLTTGVVSLTGGSQSGFAPLYVLVITAAAFLLPFRGVILIGFFAGLLYFASIGWIAESPVDLGVILQTGLFASIAVAAGVLAERLRQTGTVLGEVEAELRALRLDTGEILGTIQSGVLTVDPDGRLAYMNPAAAQLLGLSLAQWSGRRVLDKLEELAPGLGMVVRKSAETGVPIGRFEARKGDKGAVLGVSTTVIERGEDETPSVTAIFQDITEKVHGETLRRRAERLEAVAGLSASLAHEIRNPLASIRSAVELLRRDDASPADRDTLRNLVVVESERLNRLLSEFLDFARVRASGPAELDFAQVAAEVVLLARAHSDATDCEITCENRLGDGVRLRGDADLLHQALLNLILNGAQWAGEGGRVGVVLDHVRSDLLDPAAGRRRLLRVRVLDSGPGVKKGDEESIFDPFVTSREGGTGLGLALVQRAVEAHRGAVYARNRGAPGYPGAVFTLYLPFAPEAQANAG